MNRKYSDRVIVLSAELFFSKYFAIDAAPDVRIRLATEAAIRQANREREARHRLIERALNVAIVVSLVTLVSIIVFSI
jgi:uncharacterized membrane protein